MAERGLRDEASLGPRTARVHQRPPRTPRWALSDGRCGWPRYSFTEHTLRHVCSLSHVLAIALLGVAKLIAVNSPCLDVTGQIADVA